MTTTKTIEQLKAELAAAEEAVRKQEEEERRAKHEAERAEARRKDEERRAREDLIIKQKVITPVVAALREKGITIKSAEPRKIDLGLHTANVFIEPEMTRTTSWRIASRPTGRYVVVVGDSFQDQPRVRYPQRKDGTFNIEKIVETVRDRIAVLAAQIERNLNEAQKRQAAEALAEQLTRELKPVNKELIKGKRTVAHPRGAGGRNEYVTYTPEPGRVYVEVGCITATPDEARILVEALNQVAALRAKQQKKEEV